MKRKRKPRTDFSWISNEIYSEAIITTCVALDVRELLRYPKVVSAIEAEPELKTKILEKACKRNNRCPVCGWKLAAGGWGCIQCDPVIWYGEFSEVEDVIPLRHRDKLLSIPSEADVECTHDRICFADGTIIFGDLDCGSERELCGANEYHDWLRERWGEKWNTSTGGENKYNK